MTLAQAIEKHDRSRVAVIDGPRRVTYGELSDLVEAQRVELARSGVRPGSMVALVAGNHLDFVVGLLAIMGVGAVVSPMLPTSPQPELERKLGAVGADVVLVGSDGAWLAERSLGLDIPLLAVDLDLGPSTGGVDGEVPVATVADDSPAVVMATSGVSGDAKAAVLTHANLTWGQQALLDNPEGINGDDVLLGTLPLSHIYGLNVVLLASLRAGATVVLQARFDAPETLRLIKDHGITLVAGAPLMWKRMATAEGPDDAFATVRRCTSGAASLADDVRRAAEQRFGITIGEGYGLTETSSLVSWSMGIPVKPKSVGKPIEGISVVLVDDDGTPVDPGDVGEIVVRGPGVFTGYLDEPEATEAVLSEDGWFWTGDLGVMDSDGYLYIVDRIKDIIIVSGFNVVPAEVEAVLRSHPAVDGAVVVGEPHPVTGETVIAHVSTTDELDPEDLAKHARAYLSEYKCPTDYRFVDELPVAATGKLIRRKLRS